MTANFGNSFPKCAWVLEVLQSKWRPLRRFRFLQSDPLPDLHIEIGKKMKTPQAFWDKVAEKYALRPIKDIPSYEKTMAHSRRYLTPGDRVVELGCGTGSTSILLADRVKEFIGTDFSNGMISIANRKLKERPVENLTFIRSDTSGEGFTKGSFDAVLAFNLLHLVEDLPATARNVQDLLRPGGVFISKSACLADGNRLIRALIWCMRKIGYAPYVNIMSHEDLKRDITGAGFEIIDEARYPSTSMSRFIVARKR
jgi:ubiquinone/menaquinone biosynthesis C-methylase UbiE